MPRRRNKYTVLHIDEFKQKYKKKPTNNLINSSKEKKLSYLTGLDTKREIDVSPYVLQESSLLLCPELNQYYILDRMFYYNNYLYFNLLFVFSYRKKYYRPPLENIDSWNESICEYDYRKLKFIKNIKFSDIKIIDYTTYNSFNIVRYTLPVGM